MTAMKNIMDAWPLSLFSSAGQRKKLLRGLLMSVPVGAVIANTRGAIVYINTEAERLFGFTREELEGELIEVLLPEDVRDVHVLHREKFVAAPSCRQMGDHQHFLARRKDGTHFPVEVGLGFFELEGEQLISAVIVDITERRQRETEREELIGELKEALEKVKQLSGMLPICASCKKIRDDNGYWNQIEQYIGEHSDAEFTHGICPDCREKLYPESL